VIAAIFIEINQLQIVGSAESLVGFSRACLRVTVSWTCALL
jgi:hypothetical protein